MADKILDVVCFFLLLMVLAVCVFLNNLCGTIAASALFLAQYMRVSLVGVEVTKIDRKDKDVKHES